MTRQYGGGGINDSDSYNSELGTVTGPLSM